MAGGSEATLGVLRGRGAEAVRRLAKREEGGREGAAGFRAVAVRVPRVCLCRAHRQRLCSSSAAAAAPD